MVGIVGNCGWLSLLIVNKHHINNGNCKISSKHVKNVVTFIVFECCKIMLLMMKKLRLPPKIGKIAYTRIKTDSSIFSVINYFLEIVRPPLFLLKIFGEFNLCLINGNIQIYSLELSSEYLERQLY